MNILGQNPEFHVTPTSGLVNMVAMQRDAWMKDHLFKAQGLREVQPRVLSSLRGLMEGFFSQELEQGRTPFDKSRGWVAYIELLEEIFEQPVRIIFPIRDVRAIAASFEKMHRKGASTRLAPPDSAFVGMQSIDGRAGNVLSPGGAAGMPIVRVRDALERGLADRLLFIRYSRLVGRPKETLDALHEALGFDRFDYDFDNVQQLTREDDTVHGMWDLHTIREGKVAPQGEAPPWEGVLPDRVASRLADEFADINKIANAPSPVASKVSQLPMRGERRAEG